MTRERVARGDWQTPPALARQIVELLARRFRVRPRTILEPTCGEGAFLVAASERFPDASLHGWDLEPTYVRAARRTLGRKAHVAQADFFGIDWQETIRALPAPVVVIGNPPWVTNSRLGALGSTNAPPKENQGFSGMDARTGKSNFDISEWMIRRLLEARPALLAVLCKTAVARKILALDLPISPGGLFAIDTQKHFGAAASAVLFVARAGGARRPWPVFYSLDAAAPSTSLATVDGMLVADADAFAATRHLEGDSAPAWRSGLKHDCARVMELARDAHGTWRNGFGDAVDVEESVRHPLLKSTDLARGRPAARAVLVPQRTLGEDTRALAHAAPRAFRYLSAHREALEARKSSIYTSQPAFAIFGIGPYAFAPWKVAISGLHKNPSFVVVGPHEGQPVMLDDTCYFLAFDSERAARRAARALSSPLAAQFLAARVFWDAKRPITKSVLQTLDLDALVRAVTPARAPSLPRASPRTAPRPPPRSPRT